MECQHHSTSTDSMHYSPKSESDTTGSIHSSQSTYSVLPCTGTWTNKLSCSESSSTHTLSTFHPGPTNHDRCSRPIALPAVCGDGVTSVTATTQTPMNCHTCDTYDKDACQNCHLCRLQKHGRGATENTLDLNGHRMSTPSLPLAPVRAPSVSSLHTGSHVLRLSTTSSSGGCCCESMPCSKHKLGLASRKLHKHSGECHALIRIQKQQSCCFPFYTRYHYHCYCH